MEDITIPQLLHNSAVKYRDLPFLWQKEGSEWKAMTYGETIESVGNFCCGLFSLGLRKGDAVTLISEGRNEWVVGELGVLCAGGVCVPVSVKIEESTDLQFRISHSGSVAVLTSARYLSRVMPVAKHISGLKHIVCFDPDHEGDNGIISFSEVCTRGSELRKAQPGLFTSLCETVSPDDLANICYTSGTTADPKGIMLTHRNYVANSWQSCSLFEVPSWYTSLMILPWDHSFAHTVGIYTLMRNGASLASVQTGKTQMETLKNIGINIREIKPVFLLSVPALARNFMNNILNGIRDKGKFTAMLFKLALRTAYLYNGMGFNRGRGWRVLLKPFNFFFDTLIFKKIRSNFGGRLQFFIGGGALLDVEFQKFFYALGIPMFQGYGLTEASPVISSNTPENHRFGSSGKPVAQMEIKICDEAGKELGIMQRGEIVIRGANVMAGYWKNEEATAQAIRGGWLYTGDLGYMDADGFLYVLGRFKSLLIGSDGEKYAPEGIEEALVSHSPFIGQAMLYNDQNPYTTALIVPATEKIHQHLRHHTHHPEGSDAWKRAAVELIRHEIAQYLKHGRFQDMFPGRWIPSAFALLKEPFSEDNRMINSTMKMVRGKITETYRQRINYMYTPEGKDVFNPENLDVFALKAG